MFRKDKWPFSPRSLSEIIDEETLTVIESGCCERLGRPLTVLDYDPETGDFCHRIESINEKQHYEGFCRFLRDEQHVSGGDRACVRCDVEQARNSLIEFQRTGDPFRTFECHMGLTDITYVIQVRNSLVAIAFSGQYRSSKETGERQEFAWRLTTASCAQMELGDSQQEYLYVLAQELVPMPAMRESAWSEKQNTSKGLPKLNLVAASANGNKISWMNYGRHLNPEMATKRTFRNR